MNKVECKALILAPALKTSNYLEIVDDLREGEASCRTCKHVIRLGAEKTPGMLNFDDVADAPAATPRRRGSPSSAPKLQFDDADQHPVHLGHHRASPRAPRSRHHNILNNGYFVGRGAEAHARGPALHSRAALSLLRHGDGQPRLPDARRDDGLSVRGLRSAGDPAGRAPRSAARRSTACPPCSSPSSTIPSFAKFDLKSLRTGIMAGSPCPIEVMKQVQSHMHMGEVTIAYGMTETSPVSTQCATDDPLERRVSTVGQVLPHIEIKIVDTEGKARAARRDRRVLHARLLGDEGLLERRGEDRGGRSTRPAGCTPATSRPWTSEGYVNIVGRIKDMVIRGGENVYPREIEEFLYRHPKMQDVQVIGVPDPQYGEELCAWIKLHAGADRDRRGDPRLLQGPDRPLQDPALHRVRAGIPDDRHRQDPEVRDARTDDREARAQGAEDGLSTRARQRRMQSPVVRHRRLAVHCGPEDAEWMVLGGVVYWLDWAHRLTGCVASGPIAVTQSNVDAAYGRKLKRVVVAISVHSAELTKDQNLTLLQAG